MSSRDITRRAGRLQGRTASPARGHGRRHDDHTRRSGILDFLGDDDDDDDDMFFEEAPQGEYDYGLPALRTETSWNFGDLNRARRGEERGRARGRVETQAAILEEEADELEDEADARRLYVQGLRDGRDDGGARDPGRVRDNTYRLDDSMMPSAASIERARLDEPHLREELGLGGMTGVPSNERRGSTDTERQRTGQVPRQRTATKQTDLSKENTGSQASTSASATRSSTGNTNPGFNEPILPLRPTRKRLDLSASRSAGGSDQSAHVPHSDISSVAGSGTPKSTNRAQELRRSPGQDFNRGPQAGIGQPRTAPVDGRRTTSDQIGALGCGPSSLAGEFSRTSLASLSRNTSTGAVIGGTEDEEENLYEASASGAGGERGSRRG